MTWLLLVLAPLFVWLGVDMFRMSTAGRSLPQIETDRILFGNPPPELSQSTRDYLESKLFARSGASLRILGAIFLLAGAVMAFLGVSGLV